jgi:hypothetical protein
MDMTKTQNTMEISKLTGTDYAKMLTQDQMENFLMELAKKGENFGDVENREFKGFKHFVMGCFHWGSSVKGFMYWNGVSIKFDK